MNMVHMEHAIPLGSLDNHEYWALALFITITQHLTPNFPGAIDSALNPIHAAQVCGIGAFPVSQDRS